LTINKKWQDYDERGKGQREKEKRREGVTCEKGKALEKKLSLTPHQKGGRERGSIFPGKRSEPGRGDLDTAKEKGREPLKNEILGD